MIRTRNATLALVFMLAWPAAPLHAQTEPGADEVAKRFVAAWNEHDAPAFGQLLAADADWVTASGLRLHGRAKVQEFLAKEHSTWARTTSMRVVSIHVRPLSSNAAGVFLEWEIVETAAASEPAPSARRGNNLFVVTRAGGGWVIAAGQVARVPAANP